MGEHKFPNLPPGNGARAAVLGPSRPTQVPVMENLRLENTKDHTVLMVGDQAAPRAALLLTPDEADQVTAALREHAQKLRDAASLIILPGDAGQPL